MTSFEVRIWTRVERARLNLKRATRQERPKAKRKLERLKRALSLHRYAALVNWARCIGIEPVCDETYERLRGRVLLKLEFTPDSGTKRDLRRMLRR